MEEYVNEIWEQGNFSYRRKFGIGYGIAKKFAEEGSEIAIVARNEERAKNVIKDLENQGFVAKFFKTDVSKEEDVK